MAAVVVAESLTKRFGKLTAVDGLSFELEPGTVTGFLGPNGAGKTTTLRMLLGLATPTSGRALVFDRLYAELEQPALRIGAVLEATDFHPGRTGRNHLLSLSRAARLPDSRADDVLGLVELESAADRRVKGYSLGMRQRLGLASALLGKPELLVLDEPANGLDPEGVRWLRDFLRAFAAGGRTVLVSSHVLAEVAQTVDNVLIVNHGRLVTEAPLDELTARLGGAVLVRSPQLTALGEALGRAGIEATPNGDGGLLVSGAPSSRVGEIAAAGGIVLHELATQSSSLEQVFLELTSDDKPGIADAVIAQTRAEILKIRSTRTTLGLVLALVALVLLIVILTGLLSDTTSLADEQNQRNLLGIGSLSGLFAALAGVLLVTSEYRFGTIRPTFLFTPRRSRVVGAKVAAGLLCGAVLAVIGEVLGFGIGRAILSGRDIAMTLDGGQVAQLLVGTLVTTALWGGIGVGLGTIVRNQIAAVIGLLAWAFVVEGLLLALVPSVGRLLPTAATNAVLGDTNSHLVSPAAGGLLLVAWVAALVVAGTVLTARRDVG